MNRHALLRNLVLVIATCGTGLAQPAPEPTPPPALQAAPPPETRAEFLHNVIANYFVPRVARFARTAPALEKSIESLCESPGSDTLEAARAAWVDNMLAWESASAIGFGPLLGRRSVYRIDYWPVRPNLIARALSEPPITMKGLESIGAPAKGIPTLEWLLWTPAEKPEILSDPARCAYARLLAQEVVDEARGLEEAFVAFAAGGLPESAANDAFAGLVNLTNGGLEQLGVKKIEAPARIGDGKYYPRLLSGQTVPAWDAQWSSIRDFLLGDGDAHHDNLDSFLRAQEHAAVADKLRTAADHVTKELHEMHRIAPTSAIQLGKDIGAVRNALADDVAPALNIAVQFSDHDGD